MWSSINYIDTWRCQCICKSEGEGVLVPERVISFKFDLLNLFMKHGLSVAHLYMSHYTVLCHIQCNTYGSLVCGILYILHAIYGSLIYLIYIWCQYQLHVIFNVMNIYIWWGPRLGPYDIRDGYYVSWCFFFAKDEPSLYFGSLVGRVANRISGASITINGEKHKLVATSNNPDITLHGLWNLSDCFMF